MDSMSSLLRKLSVMYLLCAMAFGTAIVLDRNPALDRASRQAVASGLDAVRTHVAEPVLAFAQENGRSMVAALSGVFAPQPKVAQAPPRIAPRVQVARVQAAPPPKPVLVVPPAPGEVSPPDIDIAQDTPPAATPDKPALPQRPELALVPPPSSAASAAVSPAELVRVSMRLKESLSREMLANFNLFLYVSKADTGPWAQHLYVFRKDAGGNLAMLYNWPASTGREKVEIAADGTRQPSYTPQGYYQLDPGRMYKTHYSGQWHQPMPYAMFFNWENNGLQTGLAIHGATGVEVAQLGSRASAGCIRIAPQNAALLFSLIKAQYKGLAPRFAYDRRTATMNNQGVMMHDAAGNLQMADGYKVLVFVEDFGGQNVVAALF